MRVVERRTDGVVIRGAKLHISAASMGHQLLTIPARAMKAGEEDYAIAAMVPVNAPGVRIINTTCAPRHEDKRDFPFSGRHPTPEGFVIAQLSAEAGGQKRFGHIKEKISAMIINATLIRASQEAVFPNQRYTNAGKYHGAVNWALMARHLHEIAGGSVLSAPSIADPESEKIGHLARKYMGTRQSIDGACRTRLFHAIRDLKAYALGGWNTVTNTALRPLGLYAQRIIFRLHCDITSAWRQALEAAQMRDWLEMAEV